MSSQPVSQQGGDGRHMLPQRLLHHRLQQLAVELFAGVELLLQLIAEGHQFVDLGDDAVLFGERLEGDTALPHRNSLAPPQQPCPLQVDQPWVASNGLCRDAIRPSAVVCATLPIASPGWT